MPRYKLTLDDGRSIYATAESPEDAAAAADTWAAANPMRNVSPKGAPAPKARLSSGQAKARAYADQNIEHDATPLIQSATLGFGDEIAGGLFAVDAAFKNVGRRLQGKPVDFTAKEAYAATRDLVRDRDAQFQRDDPGTYFAQTLMGAVATPGAKQAGAFVAGARNLPKITARSALVGGAYGGAAGAGNSEAGNRLEGAAKGGAMGATAGAAIPPVLAGTGKLVAPVLTPLVNGVRTQAASLADRAGPEVLAALNEMWPAAASHADRRVAAAAGRAIERDQLAGSIPRKGQAPYLGGDNVGGLAEVVAQSPGPGRTIVREAAEANRSAALNAFKGDIGESLGGQGDYFATVEAGKEARAAKTQPLFDEAYSTPIDADVFNAEFAPILARLPKGALEHAYDLARKAGRVPEELGLMRADSFGGYGGGSAPVEIISPRDLGALQRGSKTSTTRGDSLLAFLAKNGGLRDGGGELSGMDAELWHKMRPFMRKLVREDGQSLETMAQRAHEGGYFPERNASWEGGDNMQAVSGDDLLAAIREELAGKPRYSREVDVAQQLRGDRVDALEGRLHEAGIDPRRTTPRQAGKALGQYDDDVLRNEAFAAEGGTGPAISTDEMLNVSNPNLETLHYVKKGIDQTLEQYRNPGTGLMDLTGSPGAQADSIVRKELAARMRSVNPRYNEAMALWGDDSDQLFALSLGRNILSNKVDLRSENVGSLVKEMSGESVLQFRKGVGEALLDAARTKGGFNAMRALLKNEDVMDKVRMAFPSKEAFEGFMGKVQQRVQDEGRTGQILNNSRTHFRSAAAADLNEEGADIGDIAFDALSGNVVGAGRKAFKEALKALPKKSRKLLEDPETNAALGKAVTNEDELDRLLQILATDQASQTRRTQLTGYLAAPAGEVFGR